MIEIWYIEDFLSGQVIDNLYFSTKRAAVNFRNRLGYGIVLGYQFQDGGVIPKHDKENDLMAFR